MCPFLNFNKALFESKAQFEKRTTVVFCWNICLLSNMLVQPPLCCVCSPAHSRLGPLHCEMWHVCTVTVFPQACGLKRKDSNCDRFYLHLSRTRTSSDLWPDLNLLSIAAWTPENWNNIRWQKIWHDVNLRMYICHLNGAFQQLLQWDLFQTLTVWFWYGSLGLIFESIYLVVHE